MNKHFRYQIADAYLNAKKMVVHAGMHSEIDWQQGCDFSGISESDFLREYAWVVLSSGMRESVVRSKFPSISEAFLNWVSAEDIYSQANDCKQKALSYFASHSKIDAILKIVEKVFVIGYESFKNKIAEQKENFLQEFPFMGPATSLHLLKNIGFDVAKPDRHLVRLTSAVGCSSPSELCEYIAEIVGDRLSVIDVVLWRFATLEPNYEISFMQLADSDYCFDSLGKKLNIQKL